MIEMPQQPPEQPPEQPLEKPASRRIFFISIVLFFPGIPLILWGLFILFGANSSPELVEIEKPPGEQLEPPIEEIPVKQAIDYKPLKLPQEVLLDIPDASDIPIDIPFTPQAPFAEWDDPRQQYGCEEAMALMAMAWVNGTTFTKEEALEEIIAMSAYELENYGNFYDTSAQDTVEIIFKGYYGYKNVDVEIDIGAEDIKKELAKGNIVIVPVHGQKLNNPYFTPPGPIEHMILIKDYDAETNEFITHDPGTSNGKNFRYTPAVLEEALQDYPTGLNIPITKINKVMIIVRK